ncbi:hypothetical protein [uncultured Shimia sp.]|uniref:hypothetical protein n=1 Tax=uncultured Shimia sp. TaxID=573152 RepID=UPI0025E338C4|nr:hypothetical protein [uncultured Shimia sp.]
MNQDITTIIESDHDVRQSEVDRRHADNVFDAHLRRQMAQDMAPELIVPETLGIAGPFSSEIEGIADVVAQGHDALKNSSETNGLKNRLIPNKAYADPGIVESPLFQLALNPILLASVSRYLGFVPILATADYWYNPNSKTTDGKQQGYPTSLYHLDWADNRILKVFVHCSDITQKNGPLNLIDATASQQILTSIDYRFPRRRNTSDDPKTTNGIYVSDSFVQSNAAPEIETHSLVGESGTVFLADTSRCFHYGGRNIETGNPRLLGVLQYLRPGALKLARKHDDIAPFHHLARASMSPLERLVLGTSAE